MSEKTGRTEGGLGRLRALASKSTVWILSVQQRVVLMSAVKELFSFGLPKWDIFFHFNTTNVSKTPLPQIHCLLATLKATPTSY